MHSKTYYSISKYKIFLTLIFFQYVSFGLNSLDTQLWILIFGIINFKSLITTGKNKVYFSIILFLPIFVQYIAFLYTFDFDLFSFIRGLTSFLIFVIIFNYQSNNFQLFIKNYKYFIVLNIIFILIGFIQLVTNPNIFNFLLTPRTSISRGVTSLTPEPTAFGIMLVFLILIELLFLNIANRKFTIFIIILNIITILFIAKSATATLYLILSLFIWALISYKFKFKYFIYFLFILLFLIYINQNLYLIFGDTRIFKILNNINTNDLIKIILNDTSVFDRIMATIFGFKASLNNFFIPGGFYLEKTLNPINIVLFETYITNYHPGSKLMSLWGSLIASYGFISFIFIFFIFHKIFRNINKISLLYRKRIIFITIMIFFLGFTSITISYSFLGFIISIIFTFIESQKIKL
mgnify:CR=1 FL=1